VIPSSPQRATWSGLYWGASFGGGITEGSTVSLETFTYSSPTNPPPFNVQGISTTAESGPKRGMGASADLFLGANATFGRFVAGIQLEGSLTELTFGSSGTRAYTYFDANGPTGQTALGQYQPHVHARWMVSAFARGGWLIDPTTLAYGLVGWTGAQFDYQNVTDNLFFQPGERFWANGITVGGGLERRLGHNWTLRGEYRYTHFPDVSVSNNFVWSALGPFVATQSNTIQTRFENDMHMLRVGLSYLLATD
jgi:outer membrane immunogenic protein